MVDVGSVKDILLDPDFKTLASCKTEPEEFLRLLDTHVGGYLQRKKAVDGLKDLLTKVEAVENKMYVAKAVGKAKGKLEAEESALIQDYSAHDLKEKVQSLNTLLQAMIDEGKVTAEEKPQVLDQLRVRRDAAKVAEKPKLLEKLERMMDMVIRAEPFTLPLPETAEIHSLHKNLECILLLEKRPWKSLSDEEREEVNNKPNVQQAIRAIERSSRMWFETEDEFAPRLKKTLAVYVQQEAERIRLEEEQAWERKKVAEERELERKRLEAIEREKQQHQELMMKLEAKRLESAARPQKPAEPIKKKEKVTRTKLDVREFFTPLDHSLDGHEDVVEVENENEAAVKTEDGGQEFPGEVEDEKAADISRPVQSVDPPTAPLPIPSPSLQAAKAPVSLVRAPKPVIESKWGAPTPGQELPEEPSDDVGPSLAQAVTKAAPVKKGPTPQPKKKEKKKFSKIDNTDLGWVA